MPKVKFHLKDKMFKMLVVIPPILVADRKINDDYNFIAPLMALRTLCESSVLSTFRVIPFFHRLRDHCNKIFYYGQIFCPTGKVSQ